jgi:hypothetical protein
VFQQATSFAEYQIKRLRWRHQTDGVLPYGYDANSLAAQAVMLVLQESSAPYSRARSAEDGHADGTPALVGGSLSQIKRHVLREVTRLHHLKENWVVFNEDDLPLMSNGDGNPVSAIEWIPAPDVQPDEALIWKESLIQYHQIKSRFEIFLANERPLLKLFELRCNGLSKPQALAARLKIEVRAMENLQEKLERRWATFSSINPNTLRCSTLVAAKKQSQNKMPEFHFPTPYYIERSPPCPHALSSVALLAKEDPRFHALRSPRRLRRPHAVTRSNSNHTVSNL